MFVDGGGWRKDDRPHKPSLTPRQQDVLLWLVFAGTVALLVAPIGGATILQAVTTLFGGR